LTKYKKKIMSYPIGFGKSRIEYTEVQLDPAQVRDVHELYTTHPIIRAGRDSFVNMILRCRPSVTLKSMPFNITQELEMLLDFKWRHWAENVYDHVKMFGLCPFYLEKVPGTVHKYPVVPVFGSGVISTYLDNKSKQQFKWHESAQGMGRMRSTDTEKKDILWWYDSEIALPTKDGKLRSAVSTLLMDWRTRKIMIESMEIAQYQAARPQHVFEYSPPKSQHTEDNFTTLNSFGKFPASRARLCGKKLTCL
jgi:hypothetical protein